jgi:hypothetical protein
MLDGLWCTAVNDCPELLECGELLRASAADLKGFDLRTRMLFSCLVDADRIDSSGDSQTGGPLSAASRLEQLLSFIEQRPGEASANGCTWSLPRGGGPP